MQHGPVPTRLLNLLNLVTEDPESVPSLSSVLKVDRAFQYPRFLADPVPEPDNLSLSDLEALDATLDKFGGKSFTELRALTHEMVAYQNAWDSRETRAAVPMAFEDFFEEDSDALAGVREEAVETSQLRKAFPDR
jgi:hypothetical protein